MASYIALLRAVNVGGNSRLSMADLKAICKDLGFRRIETYIASGNVVFESDSTEAKVKAGLEERLLRHTGKPVGVLLRSAAEMRRILEANPFPDADPARTLVIFLEEAPGSHVLERMTGLKDETVRLGKREVYIHYASGIGRSKLKIPDAATGTARNLNTVAKLADMAAEIGE